MAEKKQFKAESKRLLDLMINSIYTHKEIFLRELISNASDATDKLYYKALTENISEINKSDLTIDLAFDKENRTLTVTDHGIGMNKEELEEHLGTIANSGSFKFKNETESDDIDIIGQFGVGFYSAFMVAKKVEVSSRAYGSDQGYTWVSEASDGYEIFEKDNLPTGTTIKAAASGKVIFAGYKGSYGYMIKIECDNGYEMWYAHCSKLYVSAGVRVSAGDKIAAVGSTGNSTGSHLHFEIRKNGKALNPQNYL